MYLTVFGWQPHEVLHQDGWHDYDATLYGAGSAAHTWMHVAVTVKAGSVTLIKMAWWWIASRSAPTRCLARLYTYIGKSLHNDPLSAGSSSISAFIYNGALSGSEIYALGSTEATTPEVRQRPPSTVPQRREYVAYAGQSIYTRASDQDGGPWFSRN